MYKISDPEIEWKNVDVITITLTKSAPNHNSISMVNRVIRTIRDLGYNMDFDEIYPEIMALLTQIYNNDSPIPHCQK
jgi:hypothetical protein